MSTLAVLMILIPGTVRVSWLLPSSISKVTGHMAVIVYIPIDGKGVDQRAVVGGCGPGRRWRVHTS
jgi:hypothetical protein